MSHRFRIIDNLLRNRVTPFLFIFILIGITAGARYFWIQHHQKNFNNLADQVHRYIEDTLSKDKKLSTDEVQSILKSDSRIALFAWENQLEKRQLGFLNVKCFDLGASKLAEFYNQHTTNEVLAQVIQNPQEFSNDYLEIIEQPVYRNMNGQKVKIGQYAIGYLRPGFVNATPQAGGYYDMFYKGWVLFLVSNIMIYPLYLRRRRQKSVAFEATATKDHLEWLERDLNIDGFEEDTTRDSDFATKPGWTELFNQNDLNDWNIKGEWYTKEQAAIGFPWGGSITTKYDITFDKYELEIEGQRMIGPEGFVVLFQSQNKQLTWVLGGWKNTRSEVVGYENTKTSDVIEKFRWYYVKIESDAEKLVGFLDGRKIWEIMKKDLKEQSEDLGFQRGWGVAVWSTMSRFQRIRIISTE